MKTGNKTGARTEYKVLEENKRIWSENVRRETEWIPETQKPPKFLYSTHVSWLFNYLCSYDFFFLTIYCENTFATKLPTHALLWNVPHFSLMSVYIRQKSLQHHYNFNLSILIFMFSSSSQKNINFPFTLNEPSKFKPSRPFSKTVSTSNTQNKRVNRQCVVLWNFLCDIEVFSPSWVKIIYKINRKSVESWTKVSLAM